MWSSSSSTTDVVFFLHYTDLVLLLFAVVTVHRSQATRLNRECRPVYLRMDIFALHVADGLGACRLVVATLSGSALAHSRWLPCRFVYKQTNQTLYFRGASTSQALPCFQESDITKSVLTHIHTRARKHKHALIRRARIHTCTGTHMHRHAHAQAHVHAQARTCTGIHMHEYSESLPHPTTIRFLSHQGTHAATAAVVLACCICSRHFVY